LHVCEWDATLNPLCCPQVLIIGGGQPKKFAAPKVLKPKAASESLVAREEHLILIIISPHTLALTVLLIFRAGRRAFLSVSHAHKNNVMIYVSAAREAKSGTSNHNCPLSSLSLSQVSVFRLTSRCVHQRRCLCLPLMISVVVVVVCWRVSLSADSLGNNLTAIC